MPRKSRGRGSKPSRRLSSREPWRGAIIGAVKTKGVGVVAWSAATMLLCVLALSRPLVLQPPGLPERGAGGRPSPDQAVERALRRVEREARAAPADSGPLLRRAYLESLSARPFDASVAEAVRRSYVVEPLGPDATAWRLRFVFEHWSAAPGDVRASALEELRAAYPRHGWAMRGLPDTIQDPTGRMAASLSFARLRAIQAAAHSTR